MQRRQRQIMQQILCKFILNLPEEQIKDITRLSYHAQKAFYYYIDHVTGDHEEKECNQFYFKLKQYAPESIRIDPQRIATKLQENKPVCGAIIFNREQTKVLVIKVRGKYGFPKGKWNQHQTPEACAAREVQEETGIYIHHRIDPKIKIQFESHDSLTYFFVARGVGEQQRIKIDRKQIDGIIWMWVQDVRANIARFVQKSRIAWSYYQKQATKKHISIQDFIRQHAPIDEPISTQNIQNPLLNFQLDRKRLRDCLFVSGNVPA